MTKFIEVKDRYHGNKRAINIKDIVSVTENYGKAAIYIREENNPFEARESYEEIIQRIEDCVISD